MPRSTDTNDIQGGAKRSFINTRDEWAEGESRKYYYTGHEKVSLVSNKTGNPYVSYYVYLLKTVGGKVGGEETLSVFASQAQSLKATAPKAYELVEVTKSREDNQEKWTFKAMGTVLPEADRPAQEEYSEMKPATPRPAEGRDIDTIDLSDVPF